MNKVHWKLIMAKLALLSFRKGWQSEHFAKYILSKFSFISEPLNISDDIGSDFYCTVFKIKKHQKKNYLLPKNSFAIQIKSNKRQFDITNKMDYFKTLEIPFFVGVADKTNLKLLIYSGEEIVDYFAHDYGIYDKIKIKVFDSIQAKDAFTQLKDNTFILRFPKVIDIDINFDYENESNILDNMFKVCDLIYKNISVRENNGIMFEHYIGNQFEKLYTEIICNKYSFENYNENFLNRLCEAIFNLSWACDSQRFDQNEFEIYKKIFHEFENHYKNQNKELPYNLRKAYEMLEDKLSMLAI